MLPWSTKSNGGTGLDGAHSIVSIQGPGTVHDADIAIKVTHWLSCTIPKCSWHSLAHLHTATHHARVHIQSISQGISCLPARSYASAGYPPRTKVHLLVPQVVEEQLSFHQAHGASARRHERHHEHRQTFPSNLACRHTGQHAEEPGRVPHNAGVASDSCQVDVAST